MAEESSFTLAFHGTRYVLTSTVEDDVLRIEAEEEKSGLQWSGTFTADFIEQVFFDMIPATVAHAASWFSFV